MLADWIVSLQYKDLSVDSYGAVKIHHGIGHYDLSGGAYYCVVPYEANLGVTGLLRVPYRGKLDVAEKWIQWQLNHVDTATAPGVVFDHWYKADGSGETTCPSGSSSLQCNHSDSAPSFAASFLDMVWTYYSEGGSGAFLNRPGNKEQFERIADVILNAQQADGLVAEGIYSVRYLMDNSLIYSGLKAMEKLEARIFNDKTASQVYARAASRIQDGIRYHLLDPVTGLYRVAEFNAGVYWNANLDNWYPGTVSLVWPSLFSVTPGNSKTARLQMDSLNASWNGSGDKVDWTQSFADPGGFPWASIGYSALLAGDCDRARAQLKTIKATKFPKRLGSTGFDWPFPIEDAGWLLSTLGQFSRANGGQ
jgi:hypothetical protein